MKRLLLIMIGLLWLSPAPSIAQTAPTRPPHLTYGASLELNLISGTPAPLWLDVVPGDTFTIHTQGGGRVNTRINTAPAFEIAPFNWKQTEEAGTWVYVAEQPGPYLLNLSGEGAAMVTLAQGDTLSVDRGPIAIGDTVTGVGSALQVDAYTMDLPADTAFTLHLRSEGRGALPVVLLPGLRDALQVDRYGDGAYAQYYVIPAELAGPRIVYVRMNDGEYTLSLTAGDVLSLDKGTLAADTPGTGIGTVGYSDRYELPLEQGQVVTFWVDSPAGWDAYIEPRAANGQYLAKVVDGATNGGYYATFWVDDPGPYFLYVQTDTDYTLTWQDGPFLEGVPSVRVGDTLEIANTGTTKYVLDAQPGAWVTLQTTAGDGTSVYRVEADDAAGDGVFPIAEWRDTTQGNYKTLLHLAGPAPYLLEINANAAYTLSVLEGDSVRIDAGEIAVGQQVEAPATIGQTIFYTLPYVEVGQLIAVMHSGTSGFRMFDANGDAIEYLFFNYLNPGDPQLISNAIYPLDGLCPCQLQLAVNQPQYTLELSPVAPEAFPAAHPMILGEAVRADTGAALIVPYHFEAVTDGDLAIRLEFDPALTAGDKLYLEIQAPGDDDPRYLVIDHSLTEGGDGFIVQHYPLFFPGHYTLRIKNLHGPYTLTATLN